MPECKGCAVRDSHIDSLKFKIAKLENGDAAHFLLLGAGICVGYLLAAVR